MNWLSVRQAQTLLNAPDVTNGPFFLREPLHRSRQWHLRCPTSELVWQFGSRPPFRLRSMLQFPLLALPQLAT